MRKLPALREPLLTRSLALFLPISAAITLVLLPMVALYEQNRQETLQARGFALVQAGSVRVQITLREVNANTGVVTRGPGMAALLSDQGASAQARAHMEAVFRSQLLEYERFQAMAVVGRQGQLLAQVSRTPQDAPIPTETLQRALRQAERLQKQQIWISPVQWANRGGAAATPEVLAARPLISATGDWRGLLVAVVNLGPLARDFNLITNSEPNQQRGYLLSGEGLVVNALPGTPAGMNFADRYPQVWQRMLREARGVVSSEHGLFMFLADPLQPVPPAGSGRNASADGLFVFDSGWNQQHLGVVIQVPHRALVGGSVFAQPAGRALVALLYLLIGGISTGITLYQLNLAGLQERLQTVMRSAGVGMCLCDPSSGRFINVNEALCRFFGRSEAELLASTWQQLTHPEDLETDRRQAEKLHRGEVNSYRMRKRFLRPDGGTIWGDLVVSCTRRADGTIRDLIGQISDVSELVEKTDYLEAAARAGVVGVWDWDVRSNRISWDRMMYALYGLPPAQDGVGFEVWEQAVHPEDRAFVLTSLQDALQGGRPYDCRFRAIWPDGSVHDLHARGDVQFGLDGKPERMVGVNYDVTELVRKSAYLEAAGAAGIVGVWDWDVVRDVLTWDPVMYRLYGLRSETFQNTLEAWERTVHPEDKPFVLGELQAALRGWRDYQPRFRVVWPDGSIHYLQARSRTTYGADGAPVRMIGVNYDITDQVQRELEVEQQRQLLATTQDALVDPLLCLTLEPPGLTPETFLPLLRISDLNPAAADFFSRSEAQLVGQPLTLALPAGPNQSLHAALLAVARGGPSLLPSRSRWCCAREASRCSSMCGPWPSAAGWW